MPKLVIVQNINAYDQTQRAVLTIGTFDGVHIGHRKILNNVVAIAKQQELSATLLTFFPHPRMVLQKDSEIKLLNTIDEKKAIIKNLGIDNLIVHPFDKEFSRMTATQFARDIIADRLMAKKVIIGYDHRFGRNREASLEHLVNFGITYGFEVNEISAQEIKNVSISSTKIRKALTEGDIEKANQYLGYPYMLTGSIIQGKGLGRKLQFPTANLQIAETYKLIPKDGVYVVQSKIDGKPYYGMMNIGSNPTVGGQENSIEVHFFDLNKDLYGRTLQINMLYRLRDEQKFGSVDELRDQLKQDKKMSLLLLAS